jgi:hypothetical protein
VATPKLPRKLRVTIVGHASPRWRGAATDADADKRNEKLANQRAESVFAITERLLRDRLGQDVVIEKNVTVVPGMEQPDLVLSASGEGSRDALQDKHKSRSSDDEYDRRVEVSIDLLRTLDVKSGRSLPSEQAKTRLWAVTINRLKVVRAFLGVGGVEITIRNRKTGKEVLATAKLYGVARPKLNPFSTEEPTGRKRVWIKTDWDMAISEFEGEAVSITRVDLRVGVGGSMLTLGFPGVARYGGAMMDREFSAGMPSGFYLRGHLHLWGNTDDWVDKKEFEHSTRELRSDEGLVIIFPTEDYKVPSADITRLDDFVTTWCRRLRPP